MINLILCLWEMCGQDSYCKRGCHDDGGCTNGCIVPMLYSKLARYEDLYDQGLLYLLPCKVGETVFFLKQYSYCPSGICRKDISCSDCRANSPYYVAEKKFCLKDLKEIGKTVFLTKLEAEQKLKEILHK